MWPPICTANLETKIYNTFIVLHPSVHCVTSLFPSLSHFGDRFCEVIVALTNSSPSTCRCFWGSQEGEAGSTLSQKHSGPASDDESILLSHNNHMTLAESRVAHLTNAELLKWLVSQWPYLVHHHPIAPHITLCGVLSVQNGLRSCPLDRNCTSFGFVVVVFIHVMGHAKVSNLFGGNQRVVYTRWYFGCTLVMAKRFLYVGLCHEIICHAQYGTCICVCRSMSYN